MQDADCPTHGKGVDEARRRRRRWANTRRRNLSSALSLSLHPLFTSCQWESSGIDCQRSSSTTRSRRLWSRTQVINEVPRLEACCVGGADKWRFLLRTPCFKSARNPNSNDTYIDRFLLLRYVYCIRPLLERKKQKHSSGRRSRKLDQSFFPFPPTLPPKPALFTVMKKPATRSRAAPAAAAAAPRKRRGELLSCRCLAGFSQGLIHRHTGPLACRATAL